MKILMILEREFPPDERVEKEIKSLVEVGYEVDIACFTFNDSLKFEQKERFSIYRKSISKLMYKLSAACLILPNYFNFWKKYINEILKNKKYDIIHIHDLPLTKVGVYFKKKYNIKLIADQHEYYSNWIIRTAHYNTFTGKIVKALSKWTKYENKYLAKADLVITVAEPLKEAYIKNIPLKEDGIIVVPNTPLKSLFSNDNVKENIVNKYKDDFVIFYAGGIDPLRGLDYVIRSLPGIKEKIKNVLFVLAGGIRGNYDLMGIAKQNNVEDIVKYIGWVDINDLPSYISASNICVFTPLSNNDEINKTIVTKMYQYAALQKPIIVSKVKMMAEFVESNNIGFSVDENNTKEFVRAVFKLHDDKDLVKSIKENALKIEGNYFWEDTVIVLQKKYNSI